MATCSVDGCERKVIARFLCQPHYDSLRRRGDFGSKPKPRGTLAERLWAKVDKRGPDECWEWQGCGLPSGYGTIGRGGRGNGMVLAHRAAYECTSGPIPDGQIVLHTCDNPPCCNPRHLKLGTFADNTQDMLSKGRNSYAAHYGEDNWNARLTPDLVRYIRTQTHRLRKDVAKELGVSITLIRVVQIGKAWSHVT